MRDLHGTATTVVAAPLERCLALFEDVDGYPTWYPEAVREVEVLERDASGRATRAHTKLHLSHGPLVHDFDLVLAVAVEPSSTVRLTRVADAGSSQFGVTWQLRPGGGSSSDGTRIELELAASMNLPRFLPLGGIGDSIAAGFIDAARRELNAPAG